MLTQLSKLLQGNDWLDRGGDSREEESQGILYHSLQ